MSSCERFETSGAELHEERQRHRADEVLSAVDLRRWMLRRRILRQRQQAAVLRMRAAHGRSGQMSGIGAIRIAMTAQDPGLRLEVLAPMVAVALPVAGLLKSGASGVRRADARQEARLGWPVAVRAAGEAIMAAPMAVPLGWRAMQRSRLGTTRLRRGHPQQCE